MAKPREKDIITISIRKAISVMALAVFSSAGAGVWAGISTVNSDHFKIMAIEATVKEMKKDYMPLDLSTEKWKNNDTQHTEIMTKLDDILDELKTLK